MHVSLALPLGTDLKEECCIDHFNNIMFCLCYRITSQTVYLNNTKWENTTAFKNGAIHLDFVSVEGDVNVDALTAQGRVSDVDIEYMLQDTLFVNSKYCVHSVQCIFNNL